MNKEAANRYTATYQHWDMLELGFKGNMFDMQAALLLPQTRHVAERLARREAICRQYEAGFDAMGVAYPKVLARLPERTPPLHHLGRSRLPRRRC